MSEGQATAKGQSPLNMRFLLSLAIGMGVSFLIIALALGPRGLSQVAEVGGQVSWRPHAPRLDLLASAPVVIKMHLATVLAAVAIGAVQVLGPKGRLMHRTLGWIFVILMLTTAVVTLFIHAPGAGHFGPLHVFSLITLATLPIGVYAARRHNVPGHARAMTGLYVGGLIFAGALAFLPGRLLWQVVFG